MKEKDIVAISADFIRKYGTLRYCSGNGPCACMGCVNHKMSKKEYEYALTLPEVQAMLANPESLQPKLELTLRQRLQLHLESKV